MADKIVGESDLLFAATLGSASIIPASGAACPWDSPPKVSLEIGQVQIENSVSCVSDRWTLALPFLRHAPNLFELVVQISDANSTEEVVIRQASPAITYPPIPERSIFEFVSMGFKHIGAAPSEWQGGKGLRLPEGIDHILFVVALVLAGGGVVNILKSVTGFTVGHSMTLALGSLGWIYVPARLVESGIALSIAIVAAESLFHKGKNQRWKIALGFGLLHGLGFASALADLQLRGMNFLKALFGFNVGVELGQAVIVIAILPFIYLIRTKNIFGSRGVDLGAGIIILISGYWFIVRAFAL